MMNSNYTLPGTAYSPMVPIEASELGALEVDVLEVVELSFY